MINIIQNRKQTILYNTLRQKQQTFIIRQRQNDKIAIVNAENRIKFFQIFQTVYSDVTTKAKECMNFGHIHILNRRSIKKDQYRTSEDSRCCNVLDINFINKYIMRMKMEILAHMKFFIANALLILTQDRCIIFNMFYGRNLEI